MSDQSDYKRLAFYYEDPRRVRNTGAPFYMKYAYERMAGKDKVAHLIPNGEYDNQGVFDWHVWVDWGEDGLNQILPYKPQIPPKPNIYIASDTHIGYQYRLNMAREFDWVFCNQVRGVEEFVRDGIPRERCFWLPHAADPLCYKREAAIKKHDVCFVGHIGARNRVDFLDRMFKEFPNFWYGQRIFEDCADVYRKSKIVLNISIGDDINMRVFETLSTGAFLLTNELPTLPLLFQDGVHLVTYKDQDDAVAKAKYYLDHEDEAQKIALAGHEEFMKRHTYEHRLMTIFNIIEPPKPEPGGPRHSEPADTAEPIKEEIKEEIKEALI